MNRSPLLAACALAVFAAPVAAGQADPHAGHQMDHGSHGQHGQHDQPQPDPHAGHQMDHGSHEQHGQHAQPQPDPHAGHGAPASDPHAGHRMPAPGNQPPVAPPPPEALTGPEHAADTVWNPQVMARVRQSELIDMHGRFRGSMVMVDRLEYQARDGHDGYVWDANAWVGGDYDKLWLKTEGHGGFGEAVERAEVQALWSRAIGPWFDVQAGIRYDIRPKPDRAHAVLGVQGLAPYWFEVDAALFLSEKGDLTARLEAEHDMRLTNRLILQPRAEVELAAQDVPELGVGSGLSSIEAGLRLRYEFVQEFAPYVGVEYGRLLGDTRDFARAAGEDAGGWTVLIGLRTWF
ncbi:MAG TPA: copper resistance protein B [Pedomonas sp.]|uniref:copper resistance protein B n=1 Tax=Pedomonas sp. TaxID=2976421 RepID=UPI002F3FFF4C